MHVKGLMINLSVQLSTNILSLLELAVAGVINLFLIGLPPIRAKIFLITIFMWDDAVGITHPLMVT